MYHLVRFSRREMDGIETQDIQSHNGPRLSKRWHLSRAISAIREADSAIPDLYREFQVHCRVLTMRHHYGLTSEIISMRLKDLPDSRMWRNPKQVQRILSRYPADLDDEKSIAEKLTARFEELIAITSLHEHGKTQSEIARYLNQRPTRTRRWADFHVCRELRLLRQKGLIAQEAEDIEKGEDNGDE